MKLNLIVCVIVICACVISLGVCFMGAFCMYVTNGESGVGFSILGIAIIWFPVFMMRVTNGEDAEYDEEENIK